MVSLQPAAHGRVHAHEVSLGNDTRRALDDLPLLAVSRIARERASDLTAVFGGVMIQVSAGSRSRIQGDRRIAVLGRAVPSGTRGWW